MKKARILGVLLVASVVPLAMLALADAPSDQYTTFTKTRQDIFDRKTQLRWARYQVLQATSAVDGEAKCAAAGFSDGGAGWRLPTVKELLTLVDEEPHQEALSDGAVVQIAIDRNAFPGTRVDLPYLTASPTGPGGANVWVVDFRTGEARSVPSGGPFLVRCVRAE
jgi:hypothetical protein